MSIIKCKECSREVSNKATVCPGCGVRLRMTTSRKLILWLLGLLFLSFIMLGRGTSSKPADASAAPQSTSSEPQVQANGNDKTNDKEHKEWRAAAQFAALGALDLRRSAKDPESFVLRSAQVKNDGTVCYQYRAKNGFGAELPGGAVMTSKGKMLVEDINGNTFVRVWNKSCTKDGGKDVTEDVKLVLTP